MVACPRDLFSRCSIYHGGRGCCCSPGWARHCSYPDARRRRLIRHQQARRCNPIFTLHAFAFCTLGLLPLLPQSPRHDVDPALI